MLAAVGAFVLSHELCRFLCDRAHFRGPTFRAGAAHIQDGAHVQRTDRGMRVPGPVRTVPGEHLGQRVGVARQMLQGHGAVLDEADRLAVAFQAHHDVEPGLAHLPDVPLQRVVHHPDHAAGVSELVHQRDEIGQLGQQHGLVGAGELHEQQRGRAADQGRFNGRLEFGIRAAQLDHRAIDEFHRGRPELDQMLGCIHRGVKGRKVDHAEHLGARQLQEPQFQRLRIGQRALRADQQMRQVHAAVRGIGPLATVVEDVQVVSCDTAQQSRPARLDVRSEPLGQRGRVGAQRRHRAEFDQRAIR